MDVLSRPAENSLGKAEATTTARTSHSRLILSKTAPYSDQNLRTTVSATTPLFHTRDEDCTLH